MQKNIKDYLHLYLGCEISATGFNKFKLLPHMLTEWDEHYSSFKLMLRPISDMTDGEIDKIASIILEKETHCYHKWRSKEGDYIIAEWRKEKPLPPYDKEYEYMTMGMLISLDFSIKHKWDYHNNKGIGTTNEPLHNSHEITRYLLSRSFDLFNLIPDGLALDKTKPNP